MLHRLIPCRAFALAFALQAASPLHSASSGYDALPVAAFVPERTVFYLEAPGLGALLEGGLEHPFVERLLQSAFGRALLEKSAFTPRQGLAWGGLVLGAPVLETLATLSARGACMALTAEGDGMGFLLVLRSSDAGTLQQAFERLIELAGERRGLEGEPRRVMGAEMWELENGKVMAKRDTLFVFSNSATLASEALSRSHSEPPGSANSSSPDQSELHGNPATRSTAETTPTLRGFVDLAALRSIDPRKFGRLEEGNGQPKAQALLGPGLSALGTASVLGFQLTLLEDELRLDLFGNDLDIAPALNPTLAGVGFESPPRLVNEGQVAQALVYRDFAGFIRERVDLFSPAHLPGIAEGLSNLSLFFGGRDFGDEVMDKVSPWIRLVSRPLEYREGVTPAIPMPGLALIAELEDGGRLGPECVAAFQSVIGVTNVDSARKGTRASLLLGLGLEGDVRITSTRRLPPAPGDSVDAIYNLEPACAAVGRFFVIGTHEDLVRAVVRTLSAEVVAGDEPDTGDGKPAERIEVSGRHLADYVRLNFDTLVTQKVVDEGLTFDQAQEKIEGFRLLLASLHSAQLELRYDGPSALHASLRVRLADAAEESR